MKRLLAAVSATAVLAGLLSVGPAVAAHGAAAEQSAAAQQGTAAEHGAAAAGTISWGKCPTTLYPDLVDSGVQCATLVVPMDYSDPTGPTVSLAVSRLRHTSSAKAYQGVLLVNPGGPGGAGLDIPAYLPGLLPGTTSADYDWISWDPRGVGASTPTIRCDAHYFKAPRRSYVPTTKSLLHYWLARSKAYATSCEKKYPRLLDNMTTIDSARDMNAIRLALGVPTISYYGFSYGTYLGEVYSTMYPTHLRRMVLDSTVNPHRVWYQANLDQDRTFNRNINVYFRWVARHNSAYHLGATQAAVSARYYRDLATLTKHPAGRLGPDEWSDALLSAGYYRTTWVGLTDAWRSFDVHGHTAAMLSEFTSSDDPGDDNGFAVYNAVQCTDTHWPAKWSTWRRDNDATYKKYPFLTWGNAWFNAPCLYWGGAAHTPLTINGTATKSVLMIDETLDGATPYSGSLAVRRLYPNASLIAEPGGATHADTLNGDACVDDQIARYLQTGHRPTRKDWNGPDALCKPLPNPSPSSSGFLSRTASGPTGTSAGRVALTPLRTE